MINNRDKKLIRAFGKRVKKLRLLADISQEELGFRSELSKNMVGMIERGEVNVTLSTINSLAKGLKIPKKELLDF